MPRYIDADALKEKAHMIEIFDKQWVVDEIEIDMAPTADVVPVVRGRCVVLPCKVGDTVYAPFRKEVKEYKIERVDIKGICFDSEDGAWIFLKHIQDGTVFLTREEAEAALKGAEHE